MKTDLETLDREAEQIVKEIGIPPCPTILTRLLEEMRSEEPDFGKLGRLISDDMSLAASMIKTVNSPFYGLRNKATSVTQAIALLGLRNVAELVAGLLLRQAFPVGGANNRMDEFWEASSGIARVNDVLVRHFKDVRRDGLHTFALFRDCGMLAMMQKWKQYKPELPGAESPDGGIAAEAAQYGMDHARVGYIMAHTWLLPEPLCLSVLKHHDYAELQADGAGIPAPNLQHIALTLAAESIYVRQQLGVASAEWERGSAFALAQLGLTQAEFDKIAETVIAELDAARI